MSSGVVPMSTPVLKVPRKDSSSLPYRVSKPTRASLSRGWGTASTALPPPYSMSIAAHLRVMPALRRMASSKATAGL